MADEEVLEDANDEPTELEILTQIANDFRYFIKCTIPNSIYVDWEYPDPEPDPDPDPDPDPEPDPDSE